MKKILIYGAGAIGRGFLPWVFPPSEFSYIFDDTNTALLNKLYKRGKYTTWCTIDGKYEPLTVRVGKRVPKDIDFIVTAVGARNFLGLSERFMRTETPIICCENDARLPAKMREITGNPNIFFAIPDVITSNTAPQKLLDVDPLSIVTENGTMYIEENYQEYGNAIYLDKVSMHREWMAKLYLHNTPHCIAAYLGWACGYTYLHEGLSSIHRDDPLPDKTIDDIILGVLSEMIGMVVAIYRLDREFCEQYAKKEIARFKNPLLFDPITRVAREPMRKLALSERLMGAAMLCLQAGIIPVNTIRGIVTAIYYDNPKDPDYHIMRLREKIGNEDFVQGVLHLRKEEKLYPLLMEELNG